MRGPLKDGRTHTGARKKLKDFPESQDWLARAWEHGPPNTSTRLGPQPAPHTRAHTPVTSHLSTRGG